MNPNRHDLPGFLSSSSSHAAARGSGSCLPLPPQLFLTTATAFVVHRWRLHVSSRRPQARPGPPLRDPGRQGRVSRCGQSHRRLGPLRLQRGDSLLLGLLGEEVKEAQGHDPRTGPPDTALFVDISVIAPTSPFLKCDFRSCSFTCRRFRSCCRGRGLADKFSCCFACAPIWGLIVSLRMTFVVGAAGCGCLRQ